VGALLGDGIFRFDYLIPAELFPFAFIGSGLLFWASHRARSQQKLIVSGIALTAGSLVAGQLLAMVTGLASGETEPVGLPWILVMGSIIVYILGLVGIGVGGIFLLRDLFLPSPKS
jgi:hypothetical protein